MAKPKAKAAKKKPVAKKKPSAKKPSAKKSVAKKSVAKKVAPKRPIGASAGHSGELLGEITCPSGTLDVFDVGLLGYLGRDALEPAIVKAQVPSDRALAVIGHRVGAGKEYGDCWDRVIVKLASGVPTHWKKLGEASVDFARLVVMDHSALDVWTHEDTLDGLADVVFWGRDAAAAARASGAKSMKEGYGWTNLSLDVAEEKALEVDKLKHANKWAMNIDFRPHSHHFYALAEARKNKLGAGTIEVGDAKVCLFFTSWGDGVFPVFLDLDEQDRPLQVRVQLQKA
ncbi:MAG TPA: hypothetical protein VMZ53_15115 [Kofleriaceae bacterium]|nr:hypothetical protein [Kofleriaceae bacterium]